MYARGVTAQQLKDVAALLNFTVDTDDEGYRIRFNLNNESDQYWVVNPGLDGRTRTMKKKVCYHGHFAFLDQLFLEYPDAIVDSSYYGKVRYQMPDWEKWAEMLGDVVLRQWDGLMVRDKCNCGY